MLITSRLLRPSIDYFKVANIMQCDKTAQYDCSFIIYLHFKLLLSE